MSAVRSGAVRSSFPTAGGRDALLRTIPAKFGRSNPHQRASLSWHAKLSEWHERKKEATARRLWMWTAISVETERAGTQMRENECLVEEHPCPHLERAGDWMIPIGESSHGSHRCHPLMSKAALPGCVPAAEEPCVCRATANCAQQASASVYITRKHSGELIVHHAHR